jgi:hypothetical protein
MYQHKENKKIKKNFGALQCFTQRCGTVDFVDIHTAMITLQRCHIKAYLL